MNILIYRHIYNVITFLIFLIEYFIKLKKHYLFTSWYSKLDIKKIIFSKEQYLLIYWYVEISIYPIKILTIRYLLIRSIKILTSKQEKGRKWEIFSISFNHQHFNDGGLEEILSKFAKYCYVYICVVSMVINIHTHPRQHLHHRTSPDLVCVSKRKFSTFLPCPTRRVSSI